MIYNPFVSDSLNQANGIVTKNVVEVHGSLEEIYKVHFASEGYALDQLLDSIMIGLNNHSAITKKAIESLLEQEGLHSISVTTSDVPLLV